MKDITTTWQFDHLSVFSREEDETLLKLATVLGLHQGKRPAFPFPGRWFYQGKDALLHVVDVEDEAQVKLNHVAFRSEIPANRLMAKLDAAGFDFTLARVPEEGVVQVFLAVGTLLIELDVPDTDMPEDIPVVRSANQLKH
ncbi:hypothetical protein GCE9029_00334 [Grimontia celer]|uniref:VOC domain-containing protein n=2 Tax=Grimontia TaxID=246861 RepID=A0A128ETZ7_9GAMM|nr:MULTISPECIES: hypothetical protein [Grimontia]NGN98712.1 hypothetical protein [Grimontia sedimenti]CZF77650.1 hypothetical protein GCE9029_00334 [Grimontia celer]